MDPCLLILIRLKTFKSQYKTRDPENFGTHLLHTCTVKSEINAQNMSQSIACLIDQMNRLNKLIL